MIMYMYARFQLERSVADKSAEADAHAEEIAQGRRRIQEVNIDMSVRIINSVNHNYVDMQSFTLLEYLSFDLF